MVSLTSRLDKPYRCSSFSRRQTQAMSSRGRANIDSAGGQAYSAAAMSLVFHTASPLVPTFRADVRYLEVMGAGNESAGSLVVALAGAAVAGAAGAAIAASAAAVRGTFVDE